MKEMQNLQIFSFLSRYSEWSKPETQVPHLEWILNIIDSGKHTFISINHDLMEEAPSCKLAYFRVPDFLSL